VNLKEILGIKENLNQANMKYLRVSGLLWTFQWSAALGFVPLMVVDFVRSSPELGVYLSRLSDNHPAPRSLGLDDSTIRSHDVNTHQAMSGLLSVLLSGFPECHFTNTAKKMKKTQQVAIAQQATSPKNPQLASLLSILKSASRYHSLFDRLRFRVRRTSSGERAGGC
jgi:hypothetical protein